MADVLAHRLFRRFESLRTLREGTWEPTWQEIADHVVGRRQFTDKRQDGERREIRIYDTTGRTMVNLLSGGLHSLLVNPATDWFDLRTQDPALMEDHEVKIWLEDCERVLYSTFHAPQTRFTAQTDELFLDLVTFGTGCLYVGDPPGAPVLFSARPLSEIYVAEDPIGVIDTVFRKFTMTARQIVAQWGPQAPEKARKCVEADRSEEKIDLLHAVIPAGDPSLHGFGGMPMRFLSQFLALETRELIGSPGGFHEMPYLVARWRVDGGEIYGRSPALDALADQKMVSAMKLTTLQAGQMAVAPPFLTEDDSSIVQLDLRPFGRNIVRSGGMLNPPIQPMDIRSRAEIGIELVRDTRKQVEDAFHFELLKVIQNPGLTPMTAEQVRTIRTSVERLLAPILGRLHSEFLGPLIDRVFYIAWRRGEIPDPPPQMQGQALQVEYISPITRAQREGEAQAAVGFLGQLAQYAQIDPRVLDLVDPDEAMRFLAEQQGVPPKMIRSRSKVARLRAAQAELSRQEEQKESAMQMVEAISKLGPALGAGR